MKKDDLVYAGHMLDMARKARRFVEGVERFQYDEDEKLRIALAHLLQVIGEAARHLSDEFLTANSELPWKQIIGMRHKVVHDYMFIDDDLVWDTVIKDLPPMIAQLEQIEGISDDLN